MIECVIRGGQFESIAIPSPFLMSVSTTTFNLPSLVVLRPGSTIVSARELELTVPSTGLYTTRALMDQRILLRLYQVHVQESQSSATNLGVRLFFLIN